MNGQLILVGLLISGSILAQEENKSSSTHSLIYNDKTTGNWIPPSKQRSWTMTYSNEVGYRNDRQKFQTNTHHSTAFLDHFNTITDTTDLIFAWDRLLLKFSADYGWLGNGHLNIKTWDGSSNEPLDSLPSYKMGAGYSADVSGAVACRIKFWTFKKGSLSFIPALEYFYSHFNAYPKKQLRSDVPSTPDVLPAGWSGYSTLEYSRPIQQDLFGPRVEGRIAFSWKEKIRLDFYYKYSPNYFRETDEQTVGNFFFNPLGVLTTVNTVTTRNSSKSNTTRTHLGGFDISYRSQDHWQIGSRFEGSCTWSDTGHSIIHTKTASLIPTNTTTKTNSREQLHLKWIRYIANFYGSYWY